MGDHQFSAELVSNRALCFYWQYLQEPSLGVHRNFCVTILSKLLPCEDESRGVLDDLSSKYLHVLYVRANHLTKALPFSSDEWYLTE